MLKKVTFLALSLCFATYTFGQAHLSFCTFVNTSNRECVFDNNKFITTPDSTHARLFMLLNCSDTIGSSRLTFKIFGIDRFGKEVYLNSIVQEIQSSWMSAWQPYVFTSPGKYMVKVYKGDDVLMTARGFEFFNY